MYDSSIGAPSTPTASMFQSSEPCYVSESPFGRGIFAIRDVRPGEPILHFRGRIISFEEAVALGDRESFALQVGHREYILPQEPACFVNHSCRPNAGIVSGALIATEIISQGAEVFFDYSTTMDEGFWEMNCRCGEDLCRGVIRDFRCLDCSLQEEYLKLGVVQPFIATMFPLGESGVFARASDRWVRLTSGPGSMRGEYGKL